MEHPLTIALLLILGFNLGVVLVRVFGPPEPAVPPEQACVHDPVTHLLRASASAVSLPPRERNTWDPSARPPQVTVFHAHLRPRHGERRSLPGAPGVYGGAASGSQATPPRFSH